MRARQELATVLVVDDEETIRSLLALLVQRAGAEPVLAGTAAQARELAAAGGIDLALVDKNLPDGSGLDLLRWLRAAVPDLPVVIVTGYANVDSAVDALRLGAFDYIIKPFDVAWVTRRIQVALEQRRLRGELAATRDEVKRATREALLVVVRAAGGDPARARRLSRYAGIVARALESTPEWAESLSVVAPVIDLPDPALLDCVTSPLLVLARELRSSRGAPFATASLASRILAVAVAWEESGDAATITAGAGTQFDPQVVEAFGAMIDQMTEARKG